jgi:hypothetical protein
MNQGDKLETSDMYYEDAADAAPDLIVQTMRLNGFCPGRKDGWANHASQGMDG